MSKYYIEDRTYTRVLVRAETGTLFIFGDNLMRYGHGGQAVIRDISNTCGIATKNSPHMSATAFFKDEPKYLKLIDAEIDEMIKRAAKYPRVALPVLGLGTGLAYLDQNAPTVFKAMNDRLSKLLGTEYPPKLNQKKKI